MNAARNNSTAHYHFSEFARLASAVLGSPWVFAIACAVVVGWAALGPYFGYSETWQLYINTGTTVVTFLVVFLIQNTQNRDARTVHLKLDELIRVTHAARNRLINLESCTDEEIKLLQRQFEHLRAVGKDKSGSKAAVREERSA